jgi:hypothetical protein
VAIIYRAQIRPSKLELIGAWLPGQHWYDGPAEPELTSVGAYRFDDPEGEVGIETILVRIGEAGLLQVPLTYRGAPLDGADDILVGTMEHSVLGRRWVYDATGDPVYLAALAATVVTGGSEAEEVFEGVPRRASVQVRGSGGAGGARTVRPTVVRCIDPAARVPDSPVLTGTWAGQEEPVLLATVERG